MNTKTSFKDLYRFSDFHASSRFVPHPTHNGAYIVKLTRRKKKQYVLVAKSIAIGTIVAPKLYAILTLETQSFIFSSKFAAFDVNGVML
jgi:hypothetical protein